MTSLSEACPLPCQRITPQQLASADDWRATYHLSPAAVLPRIGGRWPRVAELDARLLDGWRFSDRVESDWYLRHIALRDPTRRDSLTGEYLPLSVTPAEQKRACQYRETIESGRYYRMRHVGEMELRTDAVLMEPPSLNGLSACVAPGDVVVRRIGLVGAALVSSWHRRHPVDANVAVLRGLSPQQAVWLAYCLNQPIYRSYFEQPASIGPMVRLGLKRLAQMPLAERPAAFNALADRFWLHYERLAQADDLLQRLRDEVTRWLADRLPAWALSPRTSKRAARRFDARDIDSVLSHAATEQNRFCRELVARYQCVPLSRLATLNPTGGASANDPSRVVRIGDLNGQLGLQQGTATSQEHRWRYHRQPLAPGASLVSTFAQDPKVALVGDDLPPATHASEQLAVLYFHRTPGAYALLLETGLVRKQFSRLAAGTIQRFVQPRLFKQIVLPVLEDALAHDWHHRLVDIQRQKAAARCELKSLYQGMRTTYRRIHPDSLAQPQGECRHEDEP